MAPAQGSLRANNSFEPIQLNPVMAPHALLGAQVRQTSRAASPAPGSYVEPPPLQSARARQGYSPAQCAFMPGPHRIPSGPALPPPMGVAPMSHQVVHPNDLTVATVPVPVEAAAQLSHGPSSQVRLEPIPVQVQVATDEGMPTTRVQVPPTAWVQRSANPEACRQHSICSVQTRIASNSPSRTDLRLMSANAPGEKVSLATENTVLEVKRNVDQGLAEVFSNVTSTNANVSKQMAHIDENVTKQMALFGETLEQVRQGVDTSQAVRNALRGSKSTDELRCNIKRAEETHIPEDELKRFREELAQSERREKDRAALEAQEKRRTEVEERQRAEQHSHEKVRLQKELESVHASWKKCSDDYRSQEQVKKQLSEDNRKISEDKTIIEEELSSIRARFTSMSQTFEQNQRESAELKKRNGDLEKESKDMRSQLTVLQNQHKQQADALASAQSSLAAKHSEVQMLNNKLRKERDEQGAAKVALEQERAASGRQNKENVELKQKLDKSHVACEEAGKKNFALETHCRKANWSSQNTRPEDWIKIAKQREPNASRKNASLEKEMATMKLHNEEYEARNAVLWRYIPSDKQSDLQHDLEALRRSRFIS